MHLKHPRVIGVLISVILIMALPEIGLQLLDPWRVRAYFTDLAALYTHTQPDDMRGYILTPGTFSYSDWTMTVNLDHTRAVPNTHAGGCTLAILGDSVAMGYSLNDIDTIPNDLAKAFPTVQFVNPSVAGYNIAQVYATQQAVHADGYLYLLINNDAQPAITPDYAPRSQALYTPILPTYFYVWDSRHTGSTGAREDYRMFDGVLAHLKALSNVSIVGFDNDALAHHADVSVVPVWRASVSFTDGHPSPMGAQQIADELKPFTQALIEKVCP